MRIGHLIAPLTDAAISALPLGQTAYAELLIKVDKSAQRMTVSVNGEHLYDWPVTTGGSGYDTPSVSVALKTHSSRPKVRKSKIELTDPSTSMKLRMNLTSQ
jgi:hypothetical protein